MSLYERRRRSNVLSGDGSRLPNGGNTRVGRRGSGHLAAFSVCLGGRLDKTGTHANDGSRGEAVGKPGVAGVYTNQRLNLSKPWEDLRMTSQGFKPGSGNPTVRHYRGALFLFKKRPPAGIIYKRITPNFFVVSSIRNDRIWYNRCNRAKDAMNCVLINYPAAEKRQWDAVVTRISHTLRG